MKVLQLKRPLQQRGLHISRANGGDLPQLLLACSQLSDGAIQLGLAYSECDGAGALGFRLKAQVGTAQSLHSRARLQDENTTTAMEANVALGEMTILLELPSLSSLVGRDRKRFSKRCDLTVASRPCKS